MTGRQPYKTDLSDERWAVIQPVITAWLGPAPFGERPSGQIRDAETVNALLCPPLKSGDGTLRLIVFMGAAACAALTLGGGAWLAGLL